MPMAVPRANGVPRTNGVAHAPKPRAASLPKASAPRAPQRVQKAASTAGDNPANGVTSAYAIMASRIANRVAEMAEGITFVER
ncbi:hypothetical protein M8818_004556 [Zalaria obscura]|uniref:Uncharacterized protein n=1 Tax=Zalaria obscura TaxID=2024903 RepID=A0ACC3SBJ1_9PEZI